MRQKGTVFAADGKSVYGWNDSPNVKKHIDAGGSFVPGGNNVPSNRDERQESNRQVIRNRRKARKRLRELVQSGEVMANQAEAWELVAKLI